MFVVKVNKVKQLLKIFLSWLEKGIFSGAIDRKKSFVSTVDKRHLQE
jgi:hypothetical protein